MFATASHNRRELAHRQNDGIDVTLFWNEGTTKVTIDVLDAHAGKALEFVVNGSAALDAFNHPYAYSATQRVRTIAPLSVAVTH